MEGATEPDLWSAREVAVCPSTVKDYGAVTFPRGPSRPMGGLIPRGSLGRVMVCQWGGSWSDHEVRFALGV
jgi:hypothetical protein